MYVCMSHFFTNFFLREKVHIVSARHISTLLCVEMTMCLKFWDIVSARVIFTFSDIDSEGDMLTHALTHIQGDPKLLPPPLYKQNGVALEQIDVHY